jgi:spermidine synthase
MTSGPIAGLLAINVILLLTFLFSPRNAKRSKDMVFLSLLFFASGMPALVYQVVWQRALFAIYGINSQSVAVVVTAFMLGLGVGSLVGGWLSSRFPKRGILFFAIAELGVALFGLASLRIFHWASVYTAGANLGSVIFFSLCLLLVPTVLMGATFPLLVEYLVLRTNRVGASVSILYFVNTSGSAVASYLCAILLLRNFGQSGSVSIAACVNALVGGSAYLFARNVERESKEEAPSPEKPKSFAASMPLFFAMALAGLSGFIALGFEIAWYRVFALASADRAPAFAMLLATCLAGIALGSFLTEKWAESQGAASVNLLLGALLLTAGAISVYLPPLVATFLARKISYLASAPFFFLASAFVGSVLPVVCQLAIPPEQEAGRKVSLVYVSNILGSALGSLGVGFVLTQYFGLKAISLGLGLLAVLLGILVLVFRDGKLGKPPAWAAIAVCSSLAAIALSAGTYSLLYERLIFGSRPEARTPFAQIVENRNGVIAITADREVFGGGVYDGAYNVNPMDDVNQVVRAYALSAFSPSPKRMLVIGIASASWAQVLANHPQVESLDAIDINPGYLQLIPKYAVVDSFLKNPKVHVYVDDARRWILAHPEVRYDAIIANTTFNWRDHSSVLLSVEFLQLMKSHLNPGGVYYFNTTSANEPVATALRVYPYGLRVMNFLAVSDSPINVDKERWLAVLRRYRIDDKIVFDAADPACQKILSVYMMLADTVNAPPRLIGMESTDSLRMRTQRSLIITDDNMGLEWRSDPEIPWR